MNQREHLLTILMEEASEVAKEVCKSLRFGTEDRNVLNPEGPTTLERVIEELNDFVAVVDLLTMEGILPQRWGDAKKQLDKRQRVRKFMEYARKVGALQ